VNDLDEDKNELNFDFDNMPEADMLLNGSITEDEIKRVINKENRTCDLCKSGIGNEFHFLFKCEHPEIKELRLKYIPTYYTTNPSESKMKGMLSLCHVQMYKKVSFFINKILKYL
jgi:hypothetical protein